MQRSGIGIIAVLLISILTPPLAAEAQQAGKVYRIGVLSPSSPSDPERLASPFGERGLAAFRQGLRDLGYVEGQNIAIEYRWAEGRFERLPDLAAELVRLKVDVIVSVVTQASLAAKNATRTIPIVMIFSSEPVIAGLVAGLARPGGNVTGVSTIQTELDPKRLAMLKEIPADIIYEELMEGYVVTRFTALYLDHDAGRIRPPALT